MFDVGEAEEFTRRVHIAEGDADETCCHARPCDLHGIGIGASTAGFGGDLVGDLLIVASGFDHLEDDWIDVCASADAWPFSDVGCAVLGLAEAGVVDREIDIDGQAGLCAQSLGGGAGTTESDFFLDCSDGIHADIFV